MKKKLSLPKLEKKAWDLFSKFVRLGYANNDGFVACVTCGRILPWQDSHAGHFVKSSNKLVKFDKQNVHPQCPKCNTFEGGRQDDYSAFIIAKYGMSTFKRLIAAKGKTCLRTRDDFEEMIVNYKRRFIELQKESVRYE